ncbi:hypothetical protein LTR47_002802 [Exophiala xenobiotica]|nr:hypothetical protein LTR92_004852 [Exophiala xenobiotica]KAK5209910.1 hypothetical protein LTR41_004542 [Exophiala xenobiotica]KAK5225785.1 hypothetical protein LTR72_003688 [Exophiala xenobiotica]KAK5236076.1 hypothetical protein LTR47_002802 [Exophiala xenobiotica]KAK5253784.1 hypothetical protein LTS06_001913 [Exophiala xenobiotica]
MVSRRGALRKASHEKIERVEEAAAQYFLKKKKRSTTHSEPLTPASQLEHQYRSQPPSDLSSHVLPNTEGGYFEVVPVREGEEDKGALSPTDLIDPGTNKVLKTVRLHREESTQEPNHRRFQSRDPAVTDEEIKTTLALERACAASGQNMESVLLSISMYADRNSLIIIYKATKISTNETMDLRAGAEQAPQGRA